jgi:hypothetical protein
MTFCDGGTATTCSICALFMFAGVITESAAFVIQLALDISDNVYAEIVDGRDGDAAAEQDAAVYKNVIANHGNIRTTYNLLKNVESIMTGIDTALKQRGAIRHLQVIDCINTTLVGNVANCSMPSCENPTKLCDGSFNYEYISQLEGGEYHNRTMGYLCILSRVAHTKLSHLLSPQLDVMGLTLMGMGKWTTAKISTLRN